MKTKAMWWMSWCVVWVSACSLMSDLPAECEGECVEVGGGVDAADAARACEVGECEDAGEVGSGCPGAPASESLATLEELVAWHEVIARQSPNRSGDALHDGWVDWLDDAFAGLGLEVQARDHVLSDQALGATRLRATTPTFEREIEVDALPRGGLTGPTWVKGAASYIGAGDEVPQDLTGMIVVRELPLGAIPADLLFGRAWAVIDPDATFDGQPHYGPGQALERPWMTTGVDDDVEALAARGATAVVYLRDLNAEDARQMWVQTRLLETPAVVLSGEEGSQLRGALKAGAQVELEVLVEGARSSDFVARSLSARLDGPAGAGVIMLQTHTDTLNPVQENGALGLLMLARHYAAMPAECRPAELWFELSAGHRNGVVGARAASEDARALGSRLLGVFSVEHLGALEFQPEAVDGAEKEMVSTGFSEPAALTFSPGRTALAQSWVEALGRREVDRVVVLEGTGYFGESKVFASAGLPTYEFIAGPWVQNSPGVGLEALDLEDMRRKVAFLADATEALASVGVEQ